ncbi:hypothetical protein N7450_004365 [Penicillium hetheringtonii]|uniref:Zn(2)-C6 fungal-type domain-containing protein n=1 Tax=Penicillium hetheringtonii TaxID=911720 RepID=A0AAD6DPU1_9EURO|nr:hypothetical protein N7450_004365 [Penicillium hetheringtonii]
METETIDKNTRKGEGRPYRSHLHPACFSCRKRKSRCKTRDTSDTCMMCQAHGTQCIFPRPDSPYQVYQKVPPRKSPTNVAVGFDENPHGSLRPRSYNPRTLPQAADHLGTYRENPNRLERPRSSPAYDHQNHASTRNEGNADNLPSLIGIVAEAGDNSSHIISPAVADDNDILESYLSAAQTEKRRCLARSNHTSNAPLRPVRFNVVPRRPLGVSVKQSLAEAKVELIERYMDPNIEEFLNLFFSKANICFPLFDEASFRNAYSTHKEKISPALLCCLYANSLVYWKSSSKVTRTGRIPDIRFIWNQANEALNSELFLSPGISTVLAILINVCGRPSTSMFGNGGMVGTAVALSNALGLNRDPSSWSISPLEKSLRVRIWWLVLIHDRWCSLAYGTPLQVHRAQYDVPFPVLDDLCGPSATPYQKGTASVFIAFTSLTDVLARYLEHVYSVSKDFPHSNEHALEQLLSDWEDSLSEDIRRIILRGTHLDIPGAANFRLAYLAVKLLLRRIQLDLNKGFEDPFTRDDTKLPYYKQAQRAAEDIALLIQELDGTQLNGFWIPVHSFSITSATMFLLRSGLRMNDQTRNMPLSIAKDMISVLQAHRQNFDWDLADNCLEQCGELVEKIGMVGVDCDPSVAATGPEFPEFSENLDIDPAILEELFFGISGFPQGFEV